MRRSFERHLARCAPAANRLTAAGHADPTVLALLAVETFYRPRPMRLVEYAYWAAASALRRPGLERLSVGRSQLKLANWEALGLIEDTRFSRRSLATVRDLEANYHACREFLERDDMLTETDEATLSRFYSGSAGRYPQMLRTAIRAASPSPSARA